VSALLDAYLAQLKVTFAVQLQYRASLMIWLLGTVLEPTIYLVVWSTVARAQGGQVGGFSPGEFAAYFIVTMLVNHFTFTWIMHEFEFMVRMGQLSPQLLRPIHPIHMHVADNLTYKLLTGVVILPVAAVLAWAFGAELRPEAWSVALAVPALVMSFATRLILGWTLALAAFWTTRVFAINEMYFVASLFLSGQMAPLALLPGPAQLVANLLPFRWVVGLAAEAVWLGLTFVLMSKIWREGLKRYSAVGA
jgi:ABC-2 type transport system permease protein